MFIKLSSPSGQLHYYLAEVFPGMSGNPCLFPANFTEFTILALQRGGGTCLFGRMKIREFKFEEMKNQEHQWSEDRRSEVLQFEDVRITKSEALSVKKGCLNVKILMIQAMIPPPPKSEEQPSKLHTPDKLVCRSRTEKKKKY